MSQPFSVFDPSSDPIRNKANWLGRYLTVEKKYDKKLRSALVDAAENIDEVFGSLVKENVSTKVERVRIALAHKEVRRQIEDLFGTTGYLIRDNRQDAAVAAVNAKLFDERGVLSWLFPEKINREQYADSLRQSARRNIESVAARVLVTEKPLSARVYKTQALANGLVGRTVNNALARGDSARNLAKDVRALIDPNVPGGVSYAAMRLGRTEINNAFHAQSIFDTQETPWVQEMRWYLSKRHEKDPGDECEIYAAQGLFAKERVPEKPHPNCRCFVTPELPSYDEFESALLQGHYDPYLDSVMGQPNSEIGGKFESPTEIKGRTETKPKPVEWSGPEVGKPLPPKDVVSQDIDDVWQSGQFDTYKDSLRHGARQAQGNGYYRFPRQLRDEIIEEANSTGKISVRNDPGQLQNYGKEIVARARNSEPTTKPLFRGMQVEKIDLSNYEPGTRISLPLSSFDDQDWAIDFAQGKAWKAKEVQRLKDPTGVIFQLEPGAKVANVGASSEKIAFGQFDIVAINPPKNVTVVRLSQEVTTLRPTVVVIRQRSMIEDAVGGFGKFAAKAEKTGIPDSEIVKTVVTQGMTKRSKKLLAQLQELLPETDIIFPDGLDERVLTKAIESLESLVKKFPEASKELRALHFGYTDAGRAPGETKTEGWSKVFRGGRGSQMKLNAERFSDYADLKEYMLEAAKNGFHDSGVGDDPVKTVITHEFGHHVNHLLGYPNSPAGISPNKIGDGIKEYYDDLMAATGQDDKRNWDDLNIWLEKEIAKTHKYSWKEEYRKIKGFIPNDMRQLDLNEFMPTAFEKVELRPELATDLDKAIHRFMVRGLKKMLLGEK